MDVEVEMVVDRGHDGVVEDVADGVGELGRVVAQTVGLSRPVLASIVGSKPG